MLFILAGLFVGTTCALVGLWAELLDPRGLMQALTLSVKIPPSAHHTLPSQYLWGAGV